MHWAYVGGLFIATFAAVYIANSIYCQFLIRIAGPLPGLLRGPLAFLAWLLWILFIIAGLVTWYIFFAEMVSPAVGGEEAWLVILPAALFGLAFGMGYMPTARRYNKQLQDIGFKVR